jgi:purine-binding chemotaxis protein CheW
MDRGTLVAFTAAGRRLAVPIADLANVLPLPSLEAPVGAPPFVEGFFDYAGSPVAVVRIDRLLNLGQEKLGVYSPLLLLKERDPRVALHVATVTSIVRSSDTEVQPIGRDETFNACVVGRISHRGNTVYILSTANLLLAEERARLVSLRAMRKRRIDTLARDGDDAA